MMNHTAISLLALLIVGLTACRPSGTSQQVVDTQAVERQQAQYSKAQPIPAYEWSLERHLLIELYNLRNARIATHSVWRSDYGYIEGDCPSMGYGLPYDTSLTNPIMATDEDYDGYDKNALTSIGQAEPNGIFASTNTSATWIMCTGEFGSIEPIYVEAKVTAYPYPVEVDYGTNRVVKAGNASASISVGTQPPP